VQGVGYRLFARACARELGLDGWVRNLDDGRVELEACGPPERLDEFERLLRQGPRGGWVQAVSVVRSEGEGDGLGFQVRV
jgi:acylphosphatase